MDTRTGEIVHLTAAEAALHDMNRKERRMYAAEQRREARRERKRGSSW